MRELNADEQRVLGAVSSSKCITPQRLANLVCLPENKVRDILQRLFLKNLVVQVEAYALNRQPETEDAILQALFYQKGLGDRTAKDIASCIGKDLEEVSEALERLVAQQKISRRVGKNKQSIYFFLPPD